MGYPCAKFGDFSLVDRITEAGQRCAHAITIGVSNNNN